MKSKVPSNYQQCNYNVSSNEFYPQQYFFILDHQPINDQNLRIKKIRNPAARKMLHQNTNQNRDTTDQNRDTTDRNRDTTDQQ